MENKNKEHNNLLPNLAAPVQRSTTGSNPDLLAELSEEVLTASGQGVAPSYICIDTGIRFGGDNCGIPFAGDDAE